MFEFYGRFTRAQFLRASAIRIGLFAASVIGFPFLLAALAQTSGCRGIGGACGALGTRRRCRRQAAGIRVVRLFVCRNFRAARPRYWPTGLARSFRSIFLHRRLAVSGDRERTMVARVFGRRFVPVFSAFHASGIGGNRDPLRGAFGSGRSQCRGFIRPRRVPRVGATVFAALIHCGFEHGENSGQNFIGACSRPDGNCIQAWIAR